MSKVFTSKQFIDKLYWLANKVRNKYYSGKLWLTYDKNDDKFRMDCVLSVKGILWNFTGNKNAYRGGAVYCSNGVADFTCNGGLTEHCSDISQDFSKITPGEYLCMKGTKYNHTGIYLGNGKVFECTTGWGVNRCVISDIDKYGTRSYQGKKLLKWTYHGKLEYIDYTDEPTPTPTKYKYYQSYDNVKNKFLPKVVIGSSDYAGNYGNAMGGLKVYDGFTYRVHLLGKPKNDWLSWVSKADDTNSGYAGIKGKNIDGVQIKNAKYRVHLLGKPKNDWLDWVDTVSDTSYGYAGIYGKAIDCIQIAYK